MRLDLAGHGESGRGRRDYTTGAFGADVAAVAEQLGLRRMVLAGYSMGGPVSVEAARRLGERVIGVVGVDTFSTGRSTRSSRTSRAARIRTRGPHHSGAAGCEHNILCFAPLVGTFYAGRPTRYRPRGARIRDGS